MKRLIILLFAVSLILSSCLKPVGSDLDSITSDLVTTPGSTEEKTTDTVADDTEITPDNEKEDETATSLPCLVGLYDELGAPGAYTRLSEWNEPWIAGKDIAVFDIIPSAEETLNNSSFQALWIAESNKISNNSFVKPYLLLEYSLKDGTKESVIITSWREAEDVISKGYIEVYLYDDIHQDGDWYSHLTEADTNDETVISSVKLTAGKNISLVESIVISAFIEGSAPAVVVVQNGK
ncbi:MAG: hypothetical protein IKL24_00565 [Clostridia bacterium]|nr:hypothetical protein [Clostridia bacterium]